MVTLKSLAESPSEWGLTALDILGSPAPDPDQTRSLVSASPFAIEHSARALLRLYGVPNVKVGA
jgi:hypothetical protein